MSEMDASARQERLNTHFREARATDEYRREYEKMQLAYEIGAAVRIAREALGWTQTILPSGPG